MTEDSPDSRAQILERGKSVLSKEASEIQSCAERLDQSFVDVVSLLNECKGRVIASGLGKSGHIARKFSVTLASIGVPSLFLHPSESLHGDAGAVMEKDVLVAFAHSGENVETLKLADFCSSKKVEVVAITGNKRSSLAKSAKIVLDASVESESDPLGVVPTSSSSVTLSLGHAIAVALMHLRKVELSSFAALHPGGTLGAKIKRIKELTESPQELFVTPESDLKSVLERMQAKNLGIVGIAGSDGSLLGCITDGDVRRAFLRHGSDAFTVSILELATKNPVACSPGDSVWQCIQTMEEKEITALFVLEEGSQKPLGLVRLAQLRKD